MSSIFSRFADIVNSNINAMLDKAENPIKMIKLIIGEMEDTLIEIKAACAQTMAEQTKSRRRMADVEEKRDLWLKRAEMAAEKGRDELAKEAIVEKRAAEEALAALERHEADLESMVTKYRTEIQQLENKLVQAREREQMIAHREGRARKSLKASKQMKQYDLANAQLKLEKLDTRIDRLEADADLEYTLRWPLTDQEAEKEKAFQALDDSIDLELEEIKKRLSQ